MLLTLLLILFRDSHPKGQAAQFCWYGEVMVTHSVSRSFSFLIFVVPSIFGHVSLCVWTWWKWLNNLIMFPWGADTVAWHILRNIFVCSESDSSKCFHTKEFALPLFPTKGCIYAIFYLLLLHVFSKHALAIRTGVAESNNFRAEGGADWSAQVEMGGFAAFATQDTACSRMSILLQLSCFHDRGKPKSKLKFN